MTAAPPESIWSRGLRATTIGLLLTITLASFEGLAVAAALPEITADLGEVGRAPWVLTIYLITSTIATLAAGPAVDRRGARQAFEVSLAVFVAASVACALAPTMTTLVAARAVQGFGGGALLSIALAAVGIAYPPELRARQFAAQSAVWGSMSVLGPAIAALAVRTVGWQALFWVNVPAGLVAGAVARRGLPGAVGDGVGSGIDRVGLALASVFIVLFTAAVAASAASSRHQRVGAIVAAVLWYQHARRTAHPLLDPRHLFSQPYRSIGVAIGLAFAAAVGLNAYIPIAVRGALGESTTRAAFSLLFFSIAWTIGAQIASRVLDRRPPSTIALGGFALLVPACAAGALLGTQPTFAELAVVGAVRGLGIGLISVPYLTIIQAWADREELGRANAAHMFFRFTGVMVSVAAVGGIVLFVVEQDLATVEPVRDLLAGNDVAIGSLGRRAIGSGYRWANAAATIAALGGALAAIRTTRWLRAHRA